MERKKRLLDILLDLKFFDETIHPLNKKSTASSVVPELENIICLVQDIVDKSHIANEALIMSIIYIERIIRNCNLIVFPSYWRRLVLGVIILALKVWEERVVLNSEFLVPFPRSSSKDLLALERKILSLLQYQVLVKSSEHTRIYFELRGTDAQLLFKDLKPMNKKATYFLQKKSEETKKITDHYKHRRTFSDSAKDFEKKLEHLHFTERRNSELDLASR